MQHIKEPTNALTHLFGVIFSFMGLIWMTYISGLNGSLTQFIGVTIYGLSLIALYSASTIYHWLNVSKKVELFLRQLDHTMIYVLIAGSYTPLCLITLNGTLGLVLLSLVWALAILGIITKLLWLGAPRWLYTSFYVILGWMAIFFIIPLHKALPSTGFNLLVAGGVLYTIGAVFYALKPKKLVFGPFGFHEIFHLFILAGSLCHFILVIGYVLH